MTPRKPHGTYKTTALHMKHSNEMSHRLNTVAELLVSFKVKNKIKPY